MEQKAHFKVYGLIDPRTNEVRYIGVTKNLVVRYQQHITPRKRGTMNELYRQWMLELDREGLHPGCVVLDHAEPGQERDKERQWVLFSRDIGWQLVNAHLMLHGQPSVIARRRGASVEALIQAGALGPETRCGDVAAPPVRQAPKRVLAGAGQADWRRETLQRIAARPDLAATSDAMKPRRASRVLQQRTSA